MRPAKIAIVGCGLVTDKHHLPAALQSPHIDLAALVDQDLKRAQMLSRKYGCRCVLSDKLEAVIARVEGVVIATPNHTHAPLARIVLDRGLPVLIEKPMATTYADAAALCELARLRGAFISVGFMTRHYPIVPLVKRLLNQGFLGRVESFRFEYGTKGGWAPVSGYNLDPRQSGGGVLIVSGAHFLDRMLYWFGEPLSFTYADDSYGGVEANCKAWMHLAGGVQGMLFFSKTMALSNRLTLECERYVAELPWSEREQLTLRPRAAPDTEMLLRPAGRPRGKDPFLAQMEEFARLIREGGTPTVDGNAGALSVKLCEELYARREQLEEPWASNRPAAGRA